MNRGYSLIDLLLENSIVQINGISDHKIYSHFACQLARTACNPDTGRGIDKPRCKMCRFNDSGARRHSDILPHGGNLIPGDQDDTRAENLSISQMNNARLDHDRILGRIGPHQVREQHSQPQTQQAGRSEPSCAKYAHFHNSLFLISS